MLRKYGNGGFRLTFMGQLWAHVLLPVWFGILYLNLIPAWAQSPNDFLGRDGTAITVTKGNSPVDHTCNAVAFSQIPGQTDYFIGRAHDYAPPGSPSKCVPNRPPSGITWLALFKMDWQAHTLNYVREVLVPPVEIAGAGGRTVLLRNAYDPSVIAYNEEIWVAFECGGVPMRGISSCMGPLDARTYTIDPRRISTIVEGGPTGTGYIYSASVPNLFVFHNRVYVYWSAIQVDAESKKWLTCTVRGMQLVQDSSRLGRFWGLGSVGQPVPSYDPSLNVEVLGLNPSDPISDQCVDMKGVYAGANDIYVAAALGGKGPAGTQNCLGAGGDSYGCFRLQIFHTSSPLGPHILNRQPLRSPSLPLNPTAYDRFFIDNRRQLSIMGQFYPPHGDYHEANVVPPGMRSFPIALPALRF